MAQSQGAPNNNMPRPAMNQSARPDASPQRMAARPSMPPIPVAMPLNMASTPKASPQSPAIRILTQAHELSATAKTENDFSRIIDACRQAQAGQKNPAIGRYTNELASWALNRRGQLKAEAGRDQEALADFDSAVQADNTRWRAIHNRGVLLAQSGEFEKAFDDFSRTIQTNPKFAKAYSNRGALFVVAGNIQPALQDYKQAIELDPELAVAHRGLGRACHLDGQMDAAIEHYNEAVRLSPNDSYAIASRADVLTDLGQYAEASLEYERAIKTDPNSGHAHSGSAWLLATCPDASIRNPELAIERAKTAIEITGGDDAASLDTLAAALANSGNFAAAKQTVQQAVRLAADSEKDAYQERLSLYQQERPYRLEPIEEVVQISHQE
jgi:tetratricopeptide (TPR) repeat protein